MSDGKIKISDKLPAVEENEDAFLDQRRFQYPDMGDYYINAVNDPYYKRLAEALEKAGISSDGTYRTDGTEEEGIMNAEEVVGRVLTDNSVEAMNFFIDKPLNMDEPKLGAYKNQGVIFFKAKVDFGDFERKMGRMDGDTLYFKINSIDAGDDEAYEMVTGKYKKELINIGYLEEDKKTGKKIPFEETTMGVRLLGSDAPEVIKWGLELIDEKEYLNPDYFTNKRMGEIKNDSRFLYDKTIQRDDSNSVKLYRHEKGSEKWIEFRDDHEMNDSQLDRTRLKEKGKVPIYIVTKSEETEPIRISGGKQAQIQMQRLVNAAEGTVYFLIDQTSLNYSSTKFPSTISGINYRSEGLMNKIKYAWSQFQDFSRFTHTGFSTWGADAYGRWLGNAYVKLNGQWINISKYLISQNSTVEIMTDMSEQPLFTNNGGLSSEALGLSTFNYENRALYDIHSQISKELDDRRRVQRDIFKTDFDALKDYNVTIGDTTFFVPPTSIRYVQNTTYERLPIIRGKGAMTKGGNKVERVIEMTLYFNEEKGINGYPYVDELPNGKKITYYMNGLRALLSQFKFTPYLPIENNYINTVLNIDAVSLANIQISTNQNYPRLLTCVLTLQEFDYLQFVPELPMPATDGLEYINPFSTIFNFRVMRWYYQQAILRGQKVKDLSINSLDYLKAIDGSKTALAPMQFKDSGFKIYTANEDHLKKLMQVRIYKTRYQSRSHTPINEPEKNLLSDYAKVYEAYKATIDSEDIQGTLDNLNSVLKKDNDYAFNVLADKELLTTSLFNKDELGIINHKTGTVPNEDVLSHINRLIEQTVYSMSRANHGTNTLLAYEESFIKASEEGIVLSVVMRIRSSNMSENALKNIIEAAEVKLASEDVIEKKLNSRIKDGCVIVEFGSFFNESNPIVKNVSLENSWAYDTTTFIRSKEEFVKHVGINGTFLGFAAALHSSVEENGYGTINDETSELNSNIDTSELMETMEYTEEVKLDDINIENFTVVFGNSFTRSGLNGTDGYAAQYMGGQDSVIEVSFTTTNSYAAAYLNGLQKLASYLVRTYKLVLPTAPIRFESEISRLFGISEVNIENVSVDTVPGQPGLHAISMRFISMDRTVRSKEGIKKVNEAANGGVYSETGRVDIASRDFAELNKRLGEAEIFPDLELPRIRELEEAGFEFLRHSFDKTRVYPDPDFYFNYGHLLQSEVFREAVLNTVSSIKDGDTTAEVEYMYDDGSILVTDVEKDEGYKEVSKNSVYEALESVAEKVKKLKADNHKGELLNLYVDEHIPVINMIDNANAEGRWSIGNECVVMLMEKGYADLLNNPSSKKSEEVKWLTEKVSELDNVVEAFDRFLSKPVLDQGKNIEKVSRGKIRKNFKNAIERQEDVWKSIRTLGVDFNDDMKEFMGEVAYAVACAATGKKEYREGIEDDDYGPDHDFLGFIYDSGQDSSGGLKVINSENEIGQAYSFGPFGVRMHTLKEYENIHGTRPKDRKVDTSKKDDINSQYVLLDPYYANATEEEIINYKKRTVEDVNFACSAYLRICIVWLRKLIKDRLVPNITFDFLSEAFLQELNTLSTTSDIMDATGIEKEEAKVLRNQVSKYIDFLTNNEDPMDKGLLFLPCALTVGEMSLYESLLTRDYDKLNGLKTQLTSTSASSGFATSDYVKMRKFLNALVPANIIDDVTALNERYDESITSNSRIELDRKYIDFAEDPSKYVTHSFYDMCVHDMRGRMARAFPAYYMVLVDEGQKIGRYKLNDNFYNVNGVSEIQVHKSRKIAADTCRIIMSNMFYSYTTDDEDKTINYEYDVNDIFDSVFRPTKIYEKEQEKRLRQQQLNKIKLQPGIRLHVRMGYGSNAATMPVVFNGRIAEVNAGDVVEIVAQGDGVELMNPILEDIDAEKVQHEDRFFLSKWMNNAFSNSATPKEILDGLLNTKNGFWKEWFSDLTDRWYENPNRFGVTSFGDTQFNTLFESGEIVQNIFEGINKPKWGSISDEEAYNWNTGEALKFSIELMGKSLWDVMHICASATPDFIASVATFGFRSTIFHGHPRYYYAFDYVLDENGNIKYEKRKPFQQYHMITSYSDIIKNSIKADSKRIKTNAIGRYKNGSYRYPLGQSDKYTDRIFVDWDIYPEHQKSAIVDTQMYYKGVPLGFGIGTSITHGIAEHLMDGVFGDGEPDGVVQHPKKIATRMVANLLKNSMKDMYDGEIILLGTPSLKPHDRLIINDTYENMFGQVTVESVTHSMSIDTGITSTVVPDAISSVDDQFEIGNRNVLSYMNTAMMSGYLLILGGSAAFTKGVGPLTRIALAAIKPGARISSWIGDKSASYIEKKIAQGVVKKTTSAAFKQSIWSGLKTGAARLGVRAAILGTTLSAPGIVAAVAWTAIELGAIFALGAIGKAKIEQRLKNSQVLTIFPLKHNGKVLTSGLTGEIGSVVGSANWGRMGNLEKILGALDIENNDLSSGTNALIDFFTSDGLQEVAKEFSQRAVNGTYEANTEAEMDLQDVLNDAATIESQSVGGYKKLLILPRISRNGAQMKKNLAQKYHSMAITDTRAIESQSRITSEFRYVKKDSEIERMYDNGFFDIVWDYSIGDAEVENKTFLIDGDPNVISVLKTAKGDGEYKYDLPFLKEDAITVLKQILNRCWQATLEYSSEGKPHRDTVITLSSALIVGESGTSFSGMGYAFTLGANGRQAHVLKDQIESLYSTYKSYFAEGTSINEEVFAYNKVSDTKYQIAVFPPL